MNKSRTPRIVVLVGGTSSEREVSLGSGMACAMALARIYPTRMIDVQSDALPAGIDPGNEIVFSTLHGGFGEDGGMQRLLDAAGVVYAGCDATSSELTFDKVRTKRRVKTVGVKGAKELEFEGTAQPTVDAIIAQLGEQVVFKPNKSGSSVDLSICVGRTEIEMSLKKITQGSWLVEERIRGRELTVGVLKGQALPVIEIVPKSGVFDYRSKYTKGMTDYLAPAPLAADLARKVQVLAENAFRICGCRDYARIDFMMTEKNEMIFLEINTLPGMKETSLLPMGANCEGIDFTALVKTLVSPACDRFFANKATTLTE